MPRHSETHCCQAPSFEWLAFAATSVEHRIYGSVSNDDVYRTYTLYISGILSKEQTLKQLEIKKLYNQLVLTTEKTLSYLHYMENIQILHCEQYISTERVYASL